MTFYDWLHESVERYRTQNPVTATTASARAFSRGAIRRTIEPRLGQEVWEHGDWDVLVIMDACRVDQLQELSNEYECLPRSFNDVWSNASCSIDWIQRNFVKSDVNLDSVGYVTANPFADHNDPDSQSADLEDGTLGHLDLLYKSDWQDIGNGIETVPPQAVTDAAIRAWRDRKSLGIDRLVVHYMQPHEPFRSRPEWGNGDHKLLKNLVSDDAAAGSSVYPLLQEGEISLKEFWTVYQDNLRWVLDDISTRLLNNLDGEVVLSADHGNGLGEWGVWHHPPGGITPQIRKVPWITLACSDEKSVVPDGQPTETASPNVNQQLEALGYR